MRLALPESEVRAQMDRQPNALFPINAEEGSAIDDAWNETF